MLLLLMDPQTRTLSGDLIYFLNTLSMVYLILFAPNATMSLVEMPVKYLYA